MTASNFFAQIDGLKPLSKAVPKDKQNAESLNKCEKYSEEIIT